MLRKKNKTFLQKVIIALNRVIQLVSFMSLYIINENMVCMCQCVNLIKIEDISGIVQTIYNALRSW